MLESVLLKNEKKNHQKEAINLKNNENSSHNKRYQKKTEKGKK